MFQLQTAFCLKINENNNWQEYDLSQTSVQSLFLNFVSVVIRIKRDDDLIPLYVDIEQFRNTHNGYQGSIESLLNSLGSETFDTVSGFPNQSSISKRVLYTDAIQANYKIKPVNIGDPNSNNLSISALRDL